MTKNHKIVLKLGTSSLTKGTKNLSRRSMLEFVRQAAVLHEKGSQVVIVSSGAVAAGREILRYPKLDRSLPGKQMFAAVGQGRLMQIWADMFAIYDIPVGQVLLTRSDFSHRMRYLNIRDTLVSLLNHRVIPIINENDTVATKEIKVGDNDNLSALVANLIAADLLVLLTDQEGLYTKDPRHCSDAALIPEVHTIDDSIYALAGGTSGLQSLGTGGMFTKIQAAKLASQSGTPTVIASSNHPNVIVELAQGKKIGTLFVAETTPRESRKRWLLSEKAQGIIYIDSGAEHRLWKGGASLLPIGITKVESSFDRGAIIRIISPLGKPVASGITNYSSSEIQKLMGAHSKDIEERLGYTYGNEVVHRDNMTLLKFKEDA